MTAHSVSYGDFSSWSFRWAFNEPGKYIVTIYVGRFHCENYDAVVDDFGDLIPA